MPTSDGPWRVEEDPKGVYFIEGPDGAIAKAYLAPDALLLAEAWAMRGLLKRVTPFIAEAQSTAGAFGQCDELAPFDRWLADYRSLLERLEGEK